MFRDYLLTIIEIIGAVQCVFIAVALLYLPGNRRQASRWLAALFGMWAFLFAHFVLKQNDLEYFAPLVTFFRLALFLVFGPLLYLYLRQIACSWEHMDWRRAAPHFVPALMAFIAYLPALSVSHNGLLQVMYYRELRVLFPLAADITSTQEWLLWLSGVVLKVFVVQLFAYLVLCLRLQVQHKRRVREHFSRLDKVSLDWMRNLLVALVMFWISLALSQLLFNNTALGRLINDLQMPALVLFFSALGLYGLLQNSIPLPAPVPADIDGATASATRKYQHTLPGEPQLKADAARLQLLMTRDKPFLDPELTLELLAARFDLPARQLSQVINSALGQNFIDFVNGYRVEEAKSLLANRDCTDSVLNIAMAAGFNSKSAFYSAFKRHAGQTPSAFRADCLATLPPNPQLD